MSIHNVKGFQSYTVKLLFHQSPTIVWLPSMREWLLCIDAYSHCLVHVCLLHCLCASLHNGCTWPYAQIKQHTHTYRAVAGRFETKSYSLVEGNQTIGTGTTWWLDSDSIVTVINCRQHSDWAANGCVVTVLPAASNGDYSDTVWSLFSPCAV